MQWWLGDKCFAFLRLGKMFLGSATLEHICFVKWVLICPLLNWSPSEKTNICCCELKHFRLFPVNPRPSPRCCRLRGNRLWFCAETPCQARQPTTPGLPHKLARLPQQACHHTTPAFEVRLATPPRQACPATTQANTRLGQVKVNCSHHLKSCETVSSKGKATPLAMPQHVLPFAIRFSIWQVISEWWFWKD